jgi:hypothetical protein
MFHLRRKDYSADDPRTPISHSSGRRDSVLLKLRCPCLLVRIRPRPLNSGVRLLAISFFGRHLVSQLEKK